MPPRKRAAAPKHPTPLLDATNAAIAAATHLRPEDDGTVEAIRQLARKLDLVDEYMRKLEEYAAEVDGRPPVQDNVSMPTYLKYAESLGLTPAGRTKLGAEKPGATGGRLATLRSVNGGRT